jgi:hypothetical protein
MVDNIIEEHERFVYDEATLQMLEQLSEDAFIGKSKTYTVEESMEYIRKHRTTL